MPRAELWVAKALAEKGKGQVVETMKPPAEKCAEKAACQVRDYLAAAPNQDGYEFDIAAIIYAAIKEAQSEYATKSPDKCAEQAAERIRRNYRCGWNEDITTIITESYAPTIQVAREAMEFGINGCSELA